MEPNSGKLIRMNHIGAQQLQHAKTRSECAPEQRYA